MLVLYASGVMPWRGPSRPVHDAARLDLARRLDLPPATRDNAVRIAAGRLGVALAPA